MSDVMEELNYDKFFLAAFPKLKKLNLNAHRIRNLNNYIYYNSEGLEGVKIFNKDKYKIPKIGEAYVIPVDDRYNINFNQSAENERRAYQEMYNWYENILTRELKKHNLKYERVEIKPKSAERKKPRTPGK